MSATYLGISISTSASGSTSCGVASVWVSGISSSISSITSLIVVLLDLPRCGQLHLCLAGVDYTFEDALRLRVLIQVDVCRLVREHILSHGGQHCLGDLGVLLGEPLEVDAALDHADLACEDKA